ncbi:prepilin-type N-terminal cleavage/methylation domain-containing protein [Parelusimicrobium proximum]|uniref:type IV pilin protein n=1 Tax=Parelusimicrobium proximum TaxID=3228953 RepID=UPI003D1697BC
MKKGFTLIELLVVVLIIAILAAVALPQYTKAVEKSRSAEAFVIGKALFGAVQRYHLANDEYPTSFNQLDVDFPRGTVSSLAGWHEVIGIKNDTYAAFLGPARLLIDRWGSAGGYRYTITFAYEDGTMYCGAEAAKDKSVCESLGGVVTAVPTVSCSRATCYKLN